MRALAIRLNILIIFVLLATCGASQREKAIKTALVTINTARDTFIVLDNKIQLAIVNACEPPTCTREMGSKRLAEHREKHAEVIMAFELAYRAIAIASTLSDDPKSLANVFDAVNQVAALIDKFRLRAPPAALPETAKKEGP